MDAVAKSLGFTSLAVVFTFLWCSPVSGAIRPAGHVLVTSGPFIAIQTDKSARSLASGAEFYQGDRLWTGPRTRAQIRFSDGAIMTLRPDTEFSVDEYEFDEQNAENNKSFFSLIKGGFRTLTGLVARLRPDSYKVKTAYAIVGVRGTTYEVVDQSALYVAAWDGTISITNNAEEMLLGFGQDYNYATVTSANSAPKGDVQIPAPLQETVDPQLQEALVDPTEVRLVTAVENPIAGIIPPPPPPPARLTAPEQASLDRLGFAAFTSSDVTSPFGGLANDLATGGNPIIFDQGQDVVLRQGSAPEGGVTTDTATFPGFSVSWGQWDASGSQPATLQPDALDGSITRDVVNTVFWAAVTPTPTAALPINATYNFTSLAGQLVSQGGGSGGGPVTVSSFSANFNFSTGQVTSGNMVVVDGGTNWNTQFDPAVSTISGASFNIQIDPASSVVGGTNPAVGTVQGAVTGPTANGVAGVFDLQEQGNPSTFVQGAFFGR